MNDFDPLENRPPSREQKIAIDLVSIYKAVTEWRNRKNELNSTEHTCSIDGIAGTDKIDQRIDDAIARANGSGDREGEEGSCTECCGRCNRG